MAGEKYPFVNVVVITITILVIGIAITAVSDLQEEQNVYTEVGHSVGLTLISAGAIGIVAEIFVISFVTRKILKLEESFLGRVIPSIINTVYQWIESEGRSIPIDKNALYNLIGIGIAQWFLKEKFDKVGILPQKIAELYQETQLAEFKEPLIMDFSTTIKYNGRIDSNIATKDGLIDLLTETQYGAFNSSDSESRYVNTNGTMLLHALDIFTPFPSTDHDKKRFVDDLKLELTITTDDDPVEYKTVPLKIEMKHLARIEEKSMHDITCIIEEKSGRKIEEREIYLLYAFKGDKKDEIKRVVFSAFCPYAIKPQQRILISYEIHEIFAENDYLFHTMKSLTKGVSVSLVGFEDEFDTTILKHFLNDKEDTVKQTTSMLTTSSLMLPKSDIIISWQKKRPHTVNAKVP